MSYGEKKVSRGPCVATYEYPGGMTKRRFENKAFEWGRQKDGLWIKSSEEERSRVGLYHADELAAAGPERELWWPEGEKDADNLRARRLLATSCPHGVLGQGQGWRDQYTAAVRKFDRVTVLEDNDDAGRRHAAVVAGELHRLGIEVRVVSFPELPEKGDVSDWLDQGHTVEELIERAEQTPRWQPPEWPRISVPEPDTFGPEFPADHLPEPFRGWVSSVAQAVQVPKALPGLLELGLVSAACAKKVSVRISEAHTVPVNVWTVVSLDSGERKSAAFRETFTTARHWQAGKDDAMRPEVAEYEATVRALKKALGKAEGAAAGPDATEEQKNEMRKLVRELCDLESRPVVLPKLMLDDATPEAALKVVAEQGRLLIASPEGIVFDQMSGRYSKNEMPNLDIYLMGYTGDDYSAERIGRPSVTAKQPAISMALTTQPDVLRGLGKRDGFSGRGVLARFWYAMPEPMTGYRDVANPRPVPAQVRTQRDAAIERLLNLPMPERPHVLELEYDAQRILTDWGVAVELRLRPEGDLCAFKSWGSRVHGGTGRLCGLLHMMEHWDAGPSRQISTKTTRDAIALMEEFLIPSALVAADAMRSEPGIAAAMEVFEALRRLGSAEVTQRDVHVAVRHKVEKVQQVAEALELLEQWGVVRNLGKRKTGGRSSCPHYAVNPEVFSARGDN